MRRECWERFSRHRGLAIPTCIKARASRTCRDACWDGLLAVSFEAGVAENVPGILGACVIRKFTIRQESHENTYELSLICFFFQTSCCPSLRQPPVRTPPPMGPLSSRCPWTAQPHSEGKRPRRPTTNWSATSTSWDISEVSSEVPQDHFLVSGSSRSD